MNVAFLAIIALEQVEEGHFHYRKRILSSHNKDGGVGGEQNTREREYGS